MPLGKLSQKQIKDAFTELSKLQDLVHIEKVPNKGQIVASTNRFYTLIPHTAGMEKLAMLDNEEIIKVQYLSINLI
jgi:poly [ADP-ribose] polymerase